MFHTNLKLAFRRLYKYPVFTGINITGLTLGLMAFFFILQFVVFERSFNSMFDATDRTYRLLEGVAGEDMIPYTVPGFAPLAKENIPGVELASRFIQGIGSGVILIQDKTVSSEKNEAFREDELAFVDDDFLKIFQLPVLTGEPDLTQPNTVVLAKSKALQYFKTTDVIGEEIKLVNQFGEHPFTIKAVIEDFPENSDVAATALFSLPTLQSDEYIGYNTWADMDGLSSNFVWTFLRLSNLEMEDAVVNYHQSIAGDHRSNLQIRTALQSLANMHLYRGASGALPTFGNPSLIRFLSLLAILILLIAWINYINLSTAQSLHKVRSLSVRKVIGANRWSLIRQQLAETFLLTAGSVLMATIGCVLLQPFFNYLVGQPLHISYLFDWYFITGIFLFLLMTSFLAGLYVAIVLTRFKTASVLKGDFGKSKRGVLLRRALVTTQFVISVSFIAGTAIMLLQIRFLQEKDMGFELEHRLAILGPASYSEETTRNKNIFFNELEQLPSVKQYAASGGIPGQGINFVFHNFTRQVSEPGDDAKNYSMIFIDENYFNIYGIDLVAGAPPTAQMVDQGWWQNNKIIINESAARQLGFEVPSDALHQVLNYTQNGQPRKLEVTAIVKDYNHRSLHSGIMPLVFGPGRNQVWFTLLFNGEQSQTQLAEIEALFRRSFPNSPFIYNFVDQYFLDFYESDRKLGELISTATLLAIFISCLGLFGLVTFTVQQRTKEIGIRKVLGAKVISIIRLISKDFIQLVVIALVIATPISYYYMDKWLAAFAYQIAMPWWIFILAGLTAVGIAFVTICFQSVKAALSNPIESLRDE